MLSIAGSFLAFTYSSLRKTDLKNFIADHMQEISTNPDQLAAVLSPPLLKNIEENQRKNEVIMETIMNNHRQLMYTINKQRNSPSQAVQAIKGVDLNDMPDGEKLLWFSVLSLVGLMILKKFFN